MLCNSRCNALHGNRYIALYSEDKAQREGYYRVRKGDDVRIFDRETVKKLDNLEAGRRLDSIFSGVNTPGVYPYGRMTDEEYKTLYDKMIYYHFKYEFGQVSEFGVDIVRDTCFKMDKKKDLEQEIDIFDTAATLMSKRYWSLETTDKLMPYRMANLYRMRSDIVYTDTHIRSPYGSDHGKHYDRYGVDKLIGNGIYYDSCTGNSVYPCVWDGGYLYYVQSDHNVAYPMLYDAKYRPWFDVKHDDTIPSLGSIDNDAIKVYNPEGMFIYVYDYDFFRGALS